MRRIESSQDGQTSISSAGVVVVRIPVSIMATTSACRLSVFSKVTECNNM